MLQEKRIFSCGSLGGSRWSPALSAVSPSPPKSVGWGASIPLLSLLLLWPAQQPEPLSGIRLLMGQQHASFFLPDHTSCNLRTSQVGLGKQGDFTATQNASMMAFWLPTSCPFTGWPRSRSPIEYTSVPNVHSTKVLGEPVMSVGTTQ